jgi:DNA-binding transcriptional regulator YdaS (Cro superfamily)
MDLNKYLSSNGAPSVSELRQALVALGLEQVTKGVVTRSELRPDDFFLIWPELTKHRCGEHTAHHTIVR